MSSGVANLTGVRAKLGGAREHLSILNGELAGLTEQYANAKFIKFGRDGDWYTVSVGPIFELPPQLSLIAGDFFNNLLLYSSDHHNGLEHNYPKMNNIINKMPKWLTFPWK